MIWYNRNIIVAQRDKFLINYILLMIVNSRIWTYVNELIKKQIILATY